MIGAGGVVALGLAPLVALAMSGTTPVVRSEVVTDGAAAGSAFGTTSINNLGATFTVGRASNGTPYRGFARFTSLSIPAGASVDSAVFEIRKRNVSTPAGPLVFGVADADNVSVPASNADVVGVVLAGPVEVMPGSGGDGTVVAADIRAGVQQVVNRPGWSAASALMVLIDPPSGIGPMTVVDIDSTRVAPTLTVTYRTTPTPDPTTTVPTPDPTTSVPTPDPTTTTPDPTPDPTTAPPTDPTPDPTTSVPTPDPTTAPPPPPVAGQSGTPVDLVTRMGLAGLASGAVFWAFASASELARRRL